MSVHFKREAPEVVHDCARFAEHAGGVWCNKPTDSGNHATTHVHVCEIVGAVCICKGAAQSVFGSDENKSEVAVAEKEQKNNL